MDELKVFGAALVGNVGCKNVGSDQREVHKKRPYTILLKKVLIINNAYVYELPSFPIATIVRSLS